MANDDEPIIANMRGRADQCRRLAEAVTDRRAASVLLRMVEEIEEDVRRLEGNP